MSVGAFTLSRTNWREYAFATDAVREANIDHVFSNSPSLAILAGQTLGAQFGPNVMSGDAKEMQTGGPAVLVRVRLGAHAGAKRGAGPFDTHNVAPDDNTRPAEVNWRFYTHGLAVSEHDIEVNQGDTQIASFLQDQTESVMLALADQVADDIHATAQNTNAVNSLDTLISANDTVQGLSGATFTKYNARGLSARGTAPASVSFTSGSFAGQGLANMRTLYNNASEGSIQPNVGITDYATHERYEGALQPQERFQGAVATADGSFGSLAFRTVPVIADPKTAAGYFYFVKAGGRGGIKMKVLSGADFSFGEWKPSANQTAMVRPLRATIAVCIENRQYGSNKMSGITD